MKYYLGTFHQSFPYKPFPQKVLEMEMVDDCGGGYKALVYRCDSDYILDKIWSEDSWERIHFEGTDALKRLLGGLEMEYVFQEKENVGNYLPDWVSFQPLFIEQNQKKEIYDLLLTYIGGIDERRLKKEESISLQAWKEFVSLEGYIILKPKTAARKGWENAFKKMHEKGDDKLLMDDVFQDENLEEWS